MKMLFFCNIKLASAACSQQSRAIRVIMVIIFSAHLNCSKPQCTQQSFITESLSKSQFWWKNWFFHSFWVAMDLIRCPRVLDKSFGPLEVHRVPNLGLRRGKLQLWILSHFDAHTSFYSILTLHIGLFL